MQRGGQSGAGGAGHVSPAALAWAVGCPSTRDAGPGSPTAAPRARRMPKRSRRRHVSPAGEKSSGSASALCPAPPGAASRRFWMAGALTQPPQAPAGGWALGAGADLTRHRAPRSRSSVGHRLGPGSRQQTPNPTLGLCGAALAGAHFPPLTADGARVWLAPESPL